MLDPYLDCNKRQLYNFFQHASSADEQKSVRLVQVFCIPFCSDVQQDIQKASVKCLPTTVSRKLGSDVSLYPYEVYWQMKLPKVKAYISMSGV